MKNALYCKKQLRIKKEFAVKKITLGTPERFTPSRFCPTFHHEESDVSYPVKDITFAKTKRGFLIKLPLQKGEHIYGLGLQLKAFDLIGKKMTIRPNADPMAATGDSHAPVPFFVSTKGYGVYLDTARYAEFYFGSSRPLKARDKDGKPKEIAISTEALYSHNDTADAMIEILIPSVDGVDLYIMEGDTVGKVVAQYNMLAGGGCCAPEWGLSAIYRCYSRYSQDKVLEMAKYFREKEIAIATIGLEPGWQSHAYSCSYVWNDALYPAPQKLLDELRAMGYHVNLWEHAFVHPSSPIYEKLLPYSGDHEVWGGCVPDFATSEAKKIFADHTKTLVAMGVDSFKIDECDSRQAIGRFRTMLLSRVGLTASSIIACLAHCICKRFSRRLAMRPRFPRCAMPVRLPLPIPLFYTATSMTTATSSAAMPRQAFRVFCGRLRYVIHKAAQKKNSSAVCSQTSFRCSA